MNLTSKRMLKGLAVCVGACALSATATTTWVADSFEEGAVDQAIKTYKAVEYGQNETNYLWVSQEGDASKLVATTDQGYAGIRPITNNTTDLHLKLDTEGALLTRYVDKTLSGSDIVTNSVAFGENPVYIDTLIKFTPAEDDPEINDTDVKIAAFVNANSNLVFYHKGYDGESVYATNSVFAETIDPEAWYRLTIQMGMNAEAPSCQVFLNQNALQHQNALTATAEPNGTWFLLQGTGSDITQVSFQGTGAIDEFVVADSADLGVAAAIMLTLTWAEGDDALISVVQGETPVARDGQVASDSEITITLSDWYQINSVTGTGITYTGTNGSQIQASSGTITADEAGRTATIAIGQLTGEAPTGLSGAYATVNAANLAAWAIDNSLTQQNVEDNAAAYLDDFLLDVAPGTDPTISISSIVVVGGVATITVTADCGESAETVDFNTINGTLVVLGSSDLSLGFAEISTFAITQDVGATATIEVTVGANQFIKAKVK